MTIAFESFKDLGGVIPDHVIRNKTRQKIIVVIRATKFKTKIGWVIGSEGMSSFSAEDTYFSVEDICITPLSVDSLFPSETIRISCIVKCVNLKMRL